MGEKALWSTAAAAIERGEVMRCVFATLAAMATAWMAQAAVEFRFVTDRGSYDVEEGLAVPVRVYLEERVTGSSTSLLVQQQGVFSVGFEVRRVPPVPAVPCRLATSSLPVVNGNDFWNYNEGVFAAEASVSGSGDSATVFVFARQAGVVGEVVGPGIRRLLLAEVMVTGGVGSGTETTFQIRDPAGTLDTLTWAGGTVLDQQITSSTFRVKMRPVCDSIDFNGDGGLFDPTDIDAFLSVFSEGPCVPAAAICGDVDFNNDGAFYDPEDVESFLSRFTEGPCFPPN